MTSEAGTKGRVLILDDDIPVSMTLAAAVRHLDREARIASSPQEFFRELTEWSPTHIAIDLIMPGVDGIEIMRRLADLGCRATILITSGAGGRILDAARRSAVEHGLQVAGVLSKPFSAAILRQLLDSDQGAIQGVQQRQSSSTSDEPPISELHSALAQGEILVAYQPKVDCVTGTLAGFEALARWYHPRLGTIMPEQFIPLAERTGVIDLVTFQVFKRALRWFSTLSADQVLLSINISARSLQNMDLADRLADMCHQSGVSPDTVVLEMTETSAMTNAVNTLDLTTRLRLKGFHLSIDDFGTGYSSLVQLARLPFSELKIDKSFVLSASQSPESRTIILAVIELGHRLGLRLTAEGVEDIGVYQFLQDFGCDFAQGYLIGRPMSPAEATSWMRSRVPG